MDDLLTEPFRRLLADICTPKALREAEAQSGVRAAWRDIRESGFLDALVPEEAGGAGLRLTDMFPLFAAAGEYLLPGPFAETVVARSILAAGGQETPPEAAIILGAPSPVIPFAQHATHAFVAQDDTLVLMPIESVCADPFGAGGGLLASFGPPVSKVARAAVDLSVCAAAVTAARMAGMMIRILDMSIAYVAQREQFGRSLSKFQAIQHQLAVMAEQVASAFVAARIGCSGDTFDAVRVAMAKARVSEASHTVTAIAHAVHGAIGVTEEFDLQLYTRRLKEGGLAFGSESYWSGKLGRARIDSGLTCGADFVRRHLQEVE